MAGFTPFIWFNNDAEEAMNVRNNSIRLPKRWVRY